MSHVTCHMLRVTCNFFSFQTKLWSLSVDGLLSTGPTLSSFNIILAYKSCFIGLYKVSKSVVFSVWVGQVNQWEPVKKIPLGVATFTYLGGAGLTARGFIGGQVADPQAWQGAALQSLSWLILWFVKLVSPPPSLLPLQWHQAYIIKDKGKSQEI